MFLNVLHGLIAIAVGDRDAQFVLGSQPTSVAGGVGDHAPVGVLVQQAGALEGSKRVLDAPLPVSDAVADLADGWTHDRSEGKRQACVCLRYRDLGRPEIVPRAQGVPGLGMGVGEPTCQVNCFPRIGERRHGRRQRSVHGVVGE